MIVRKTASVPLPWQSGPPVRLTFHKSGISKAIVKAVCRVCLKCAAPKLRGLAFTRSNPEPAEEKHGVDMLIHSGEP